MESKKPTAFDVHMAAMDAMPKQLADCMSLNDGQKIYSNISKLFVSHKELKDFKSVDYEASIKSPINFQAQFLDRFSADYKFRGDPLPWQKTNDKFRFRENEVTIWTGYSGHRKSMLLGQIAFHLATLGKKSCIASMEMPPHETMARMAIQAIGNNTPTHEAQINFLNYVHEKIYIFDQVGAVSSDLILKMVEYCASELKLNHIIIDSLMKCGMPTDDYTAQKDFIGALTEIAHRYPIHIHLVAHMRKPVTDKNGNPHVPNKFEISGGSDIFNQVDNVLVAWTNNKKKKEKEKPEGYRDAAILNESEQILSVDKQRNGQYESFVYLEFCERSAQFIDHKRIDYSKYFMKDKQ